MFTRTGLYMGHVQTVKWSNANRIYNFFFKCIKIKFRFTVMFFDNITPCGFRCSHLSPINTLPTPDPVTNRLASAIKLIEQHVFILLWADNGVWENCIFFRRTDILNVQTVYGEYTCPAYTIAVRVHVYVMSTS